MIAQGMIPYVVAPEYKIPMPFGWDPFPLQVFGISVAIGVLLGMRRCLTFAKARNVDELMARDTMFWILVFGFVISHWFSVIFYFPERIAEDPLVLLYVWNGLSSVGGFLGAFVGMMWFLRMKNKEPVLVYADMLIFGLLLGMVFGRLGCAMVHDHPGKIVEAGTFLSVGPWPCGCGPGERALPSCCSATQEVHRYDLGLAELLVLLAMTSYFYFIFDWKKSRPGLLTGLVAVLYGVTRFGLDALREVKVTQGVAVPDTRYVGLTPAQWMTMLFVLAGFLLIFRKPKPAHDASYMKDSDRLAKEAAAAAAEAGSDDELASPPTPASEVEPTEATKDEPAEVAKDEPAQSAEDPLDSGTLDDDDDDK